MATRLLSLCDGERYLLFAARRRTFDAIEQPSGPEQRCAQVLHPRGESAVGGHDGRSFTRCDGSPCLLDYRVVSLADGMHDLDCSRCSLRNAGPSPALEHEDDVWRKHRRIEKAGVQPGGCPRPIVPPSVGSRSDDIRAVDHEHVGGCRGGRRSHSTS